MMMNRQIIADAGSTKVEWAVVEGDGSVAKRFTTSGLNALLAEIEDVVKLTDEVRQHLDSDMDADELHYYGAGCATPEICDKMTTLLKEAWTDTDVHVSTDLLGSARALFGHDKGIACILGTGSNSCLYDGEKIESNVPSLGYVLGDEGSGAALGKRLVADAFKNQLPENVRQRFLDTYGLTLPVILAKVYRQPAPNRFLASLVPFISDNLWNPYVYSLVLEEFKSFFKRNVAMYNGSYRMPVGFTGSIAFHFENILRETADSLGFKVGKVIKTPIDGLVEFHSSNKKKPE